LEGLRAKVPTIFDVRGLGAMVACEFRHSSGHPAAEYTKAVQQRALQSGLILLTCGVDANVLRFLFPLTIEQDIFDEGLSILERCMLQA
jgi:4-aminobutyrate aminotransferase-like enzyme